MFCSKSSCLAEYFITLFCKKQKPTRYNLLTVNMLQLIHPYKDAGIYLVQKSGFGQRQTNRSRNEW